jgi:hypothetical protein
VELDREVLHREPVELGGGAPQAGTSLVIMGYPLGLPLKVANRAEVLAVEENYFIANLDSFQGNSGSPVFNQETGEVEGILARGKPDFYPSNGCLKLNRCDENGKNCEEEEDRLRAEEVVSISSLLSDLEEIQLNL